MAELTSASQYPMRNMAPPLKLLIACVDRAVIWPLGVSSALAALGGLVAGLAPLALKGVVDSAAIARRGAAPFGGIATYAAAYLLCLFIGRALAEIRPTLASHAEQQLYASLRLRFFRHLLHLPLSFHLNQRSGSLAQAQQQALTGCQISLLSLSTEIIPVIVEGTTVAVVLVSLRLPALGVAFAATAVGYLAVMRSKMRGLSNAARAVGEAATGCTSLFTDSLTNIEPIKCFAAERRTIASYVAALDELKSRWQQLQVQRLRIGLATTAVFASAMTCSLMVAIRSFDEGLLSLGGLVMANLYLAQMIRPLEVFAIATREFHQGLAFMAPLLSVLEEPVEQDLGRLERRGDARPTEPMATTSTQPEQMRHATPAALAQTSPAGAAAPGASGCPPQIRFKNVRLAFVDAMPVFDTLNLDIAAGQSLGIVGASGCGKSTLTRMLVGLVRPQAGEILLNEAHLDALPADAVRAMIAVVPQDTVLLNTTIGANIAIGREGASTTDIEDASQLAGLHDFVASLPMAYDTVIGERGLKLSGGERQRIAIARAILHRPLIYIFDEATSMLDTSTERKILETLRAISHGRTTITIAHRLSAVRHADEIAVIAAGHVAERGTHSALLDKRGLYAAMWCAQELGGSV